MTKKKYENLDIKKFKYTKAIQKQMFLNKKDIAKNNRKRTKEGRTLREMTLK